MTSTGRRSALDAYYGGKLPDVLGPQTRLLFVGINPSLPSVAVQAPFPGSNRFFPALHHAGLTDRRINTGRGFQPGEREYLIERGIGITALVAEATAQADELSRAQLVAGVATLTCTVERVSPVVVAMLGIAAYRIAFGEPKAVVGRQPRSLGDAQLWVVPNPSGLNRSTSLAALAGAYREVGLAAGIALANLGLPGCGADDATVIR
jgi:TDG/mug DNA glycosylase family protein